ncbi:MAG: hypothetical protein PWQ57_1260 [Desulfovibrionales bacterium]|nr:hypothetical protein [Desulfovibrionales bacterium]
MTAYGCSGKIIYGDIARSSFKGYRNISNATLRRMKEFNDFGDFYIQIKADYASAKDDRVPPDAQKKYTKIPPMSLEQLCETGTQLLSTDMSSYVKALFNSSDGSGQSIPVFIFSNDKTSINKCSRKVKEVDVSPLIRLQPGLGVDVRYEFSNSRRIPVETITELLDLAGQADGQAKLVGSAVKVVNEKLAEKVNNALTTENEIEDDVSFFTTDTSYSTEIYLPMFYEPGVLEFEDDKMLGYMIFRLHPRLSIFAPNPDTGLPNYGYTTIPDIKSLDFIETKTRDDLYKTVRSAQADFDSAANASMANALCERLKGDLNKLGLSNLDIAFFMHLASRRQKNLAYYLYQEPEQMSCFTRQHYYMKKLGLPAPECNSTKIDNELNSCAQSVQKASPPRRDGQFVRRLPKTSVPTRPAGRRNQKPAPQGARQEPDIQQQHGIDKTQVPGVFLRPGPSSGGGGC